MKVKVKKTKTRVNSLSNKLAHLEERAHQDQSNKFNNMLVHRNLQGEIMKAKPCR